MIATFWHAQAETNHSTSGWVLIRTDDLPFESDVIGGPPPYRGHVAGLDGAVPFINDAVFLWVFEVPEYGLTVGNPPPIAVEGEAPTFTLYPKNEDVTPPE